MPNDGELVDLFARFTEDATVRRKVLVANRRGLPGATRRSKSMQKNRARLGARPSGEGSTRSTMIAHETQRTDDL